MNNMVLPKVFRRLKFLVGKFHFILLFQNICYYFLKFSTKTDAVISYETVLGECLKGNAA